MKTIPLCRPQIWADIKGWDTDANFPEHIEEALRTKYRPDIIMVTKRNERSTLLMIELTRPFEAKANLHTAHKR